MCVSEQNTVDGSHNEMVFRLWKTMFLKAVSVDWSLNANILCIKMKWSVNVWALDYKSYPRQSAKGNYRIMTASFTSTTEKRRFSSNINQKSVATTSTIRNAYNYVYFYSMVDKISRTHSVLQILAAKIHSAPKDYYTYQEKNKKVHPSYGHLT